MKAVDARLFHYFTVDEVNGTRALIAEILTSDVHYFNISAFTME